MCIYRFKEVIIIIDNMLYQCASESHGNQPGPVSQCQKDINPINPTSPVFTRPAGSRPVLRSVEPCHPGECPPSTCQAQVGHVWCGDEQRGV